MVVSARFASHGRPQKRRRSRWLLRWRLPRVFACTRHCVLLNDTCPSCHTLPRTTSLPHLLYHPPGTCTARTATGCCLHPLPQTPTTPLALGHPLLGAQRWIDTRDHGSDRSRPTRPGPAPDGSRKPPAATWSPTRTSPSNAAGPCTSGTPAPENPQPPRGHPADSAALPRTHRPCTDTAPAPHPPDRRPVRPPPPSPPHASRSARDTDRIPSITLPGIQPNSCRTTWKDAYGKEETTVAPT